MIDISERDLSLLRGIVKEKLREIGTEVHSVGIGKLIGEYIGYNGNISNLTWRQMDELAKRLHELWVLGCLIKAWKSISPSLQIKDYLKTWSLVCEDGNYELWWEYGTYHAIATGDRSKREYFERKCSDGRYEEVAREIGLREIPTRYKECLSLVANAIIKSIENALRGSETWIRLQNVINVNDQLWKKIGKPVKVKNDEVKEYLPLVPDLAIFRRGTARNYPRRIENLREFSENCILLIEAKHKPLKINDLRQFAFYVLFFKPKVSVLAVHGEARHEELNFVLDHLRGEGQDVCLMDNFNIDRNLQMRYESALKNLLRNLFR